MRLKSLAAATAALGLACASPAGAVVVSTVYTGTFSGFADVSNFWGLGVNPAFAGLTFSATFVVDDQAPGAIEFQGANQSSVSGSSPVTASLSINGKTVSLLAGQGMHEQQNFTNESWNQEVVEASFAPDYYYYLLKATGSGFMTDFMPSGDWETLPSANLNAATSKGGSFFFQDTRGGTFVHTVGSFVIGDITVYSGLPPTEGPGGPGPDPTGAVPEPATWALMILGFGGAGVALRRRRNPGVAYGAGWALAQAA